MTERNEGVPRVFLDTEVFIRENFNYKSTRFKSLMSLASAGRIQVFLTDLTLREIETSIRTHVDGAVASVKPRPVLKNSDLPRVKALFGKLALTRIQDELVGQLREYMEAAKITVLDVPTSVLPPVLDAYFGRQPPFGSTKNKAEFPDALVLETLRGWCAQNESDLAIVSRDKGVKEACEKDEALHPFDDLPEYLNALFASEEALSAFVREMIQAAHRSIFEKAKEEFPDRGAFLVDEEGEVEELELTDVEFGEEVGDLEIVSLGPNHAEVELAVSMTFRCELSYKEPGTGIWDSEEKVLVFQDDIKTTVTREIEGPLVVEVGFRRLDPHSFRVQRVWFEGDRDIEVYANHFGG